MRYRNVYIDAIGYELPAEAVTTASLEAPLAELYARYNLPASYIENLTGVSERRFWPREGAIIEGACAAAAKAMQQSGLDPNELDVVIYAGVCRTHIEPAMACAIADHIGANADAMVYDISNACLGVMNGIVDLASKIESGLIRSGMVVACESSREIVELTIDQLLQNPTLEHLHEVLATFTGGSGAVAVVVADERHARTGRHQVAGATWKNGVRHHGLCQWGFQPSQKAANVFEQFMSTKAPDVLRHGVALGRETWQGFLRELAWTVQSITRVVPHQVGRVNREQILRAMGLRDDQDVSTYPTLGNMGSVSVPLTAALAWEQGHMRKGDKVALTGIGSGLNCMMIGVTW